LCVLTVNGAGEILAASDTAALRAAGLTEREADVLQWIAKGKSNPDIAAILGTSPRTVQKHVERLLQKLGVETLVAAVARPASCEVESRTARYDSLHTIVPSAHYGHPGHL
jgi:DNA-binding CsgD family transcriptional regulator